MATSRKLSDNWSISSSDIRPKYRTPGVYRREIDTSEMVTETIGKDPWIDVPEYDPDKYPNIPEVTQRALIDKWKRVKESR